MLPCMKRTGCVKSPLDPSLWTRDLFRSRLAGDTGADLARIRQPCIRARQGREMLARAFARLASGRGLPCVSTPRVFRPGAPPRTWTPLSRLLIFEKPARLARGSDHGRGRLCPMTEVGMAITILTNAFLIDCTGKEPAEGAAVVVEGERIKDVLRSGRIGPLAGQGRRRSTSRGRTLMPGLTDAHVHVCAVEGNTAEQHRHNPPSLIVAKALRRIEQALAAGVHHGARRGRRRLRPARGGRLRPLPGAAAARLRARAVPDRAATATSGAARSGSSPSTCCVGMIGVIADGADEVRRAAREQLRHDVDQIKVMASGGAMSPERRARHHPVHASTRCGRRWRRRARSARTCSPMPTPPRRCGARSRRACAPSSTAT